MDFESPDVEKDFPGLYASETGRKSNESDFSDGGDHEKPSKKDLLIGRRKDKKEKKDRGYAALAGESSPEEDTETKSPSKSKKTKSFKFPSKSKEKREKSRDKEKTVDDARLKEQAERDKKKEKEKEKKEKEKKEKHKEKDKEKEEKAKFKLESKEKLKDKDKDKSKEKDKDRTKEKEKDKVKDKDKDKKDKKLKDKVQTTVTSGIPFEEIFTLGVALPIFGVPLQASVERSRCHDDTRLPLVVRDSIDYLQMHGLKSTQIYRADADRVKVQQLRKLYEDRGATFPYHWDVPVACTILKAFISELPESILTQELSYQFEQATAMAEAQRDATIAALIGRLPEPNRTLLAWIMLHFRDVVAHEAVNHTNIQVLSSAMGAALNMSTNLLAHLVGRADKLFPDVELTQYVPPLDVIPPQLLDECPEKIAGELRKQESLLSQIHAEMHAGFITPAREEQLWEGQRIVTQLKRMLRMAQKSMEPSLPMQQPSIDEKTEDKPGPSHVPVPEPCTSQSQPSTSNQQCDREVDKTPLSTVPVPNDAFHPEHKAKESPSDKNETFEDDFDFAAKETTPTIQAEDTTDSLPPEPVNEKPKLTEQELRLLKLQLENAEYLQLKSLLQAKINSEQFEIVKLRSSIAIKNKLENNQAKERVTPSECSPEEQELKQKLMKENAALEQKRLSLINQIFQERVACIQLKIELAMKEIL